MNNKDTIFLKDGIFVIFIRVNPLNQRVQRFYFFQK